MSSAASAIDQYLAGLPEAARPHVVGVLDAVRAAIPGAEERFRYGMPAIMLDDRYAIHVAGWKRHVGIYPVSVLPEPLETEVAPYRAARDALNFLYRDPIPLELVQRVAAEMKRQRSTSS